MLTDYTRYASNAKDKPSHLHSFKAIPDPNGNRAERRAAKKKARKTK